MRLGLNEDDHFPSVFADHKVFNGPPTVLHVFNGSVPPPAAAFIL